MGRRNGPPKGGLWSQANKGQPRPVMLDASMRLVVDPAKPTELVGRLVIHDPAMGKITDNGEGILVNEAGQEVGFVDYQTGNFSYSNPTYIAEATTLKRIK